MAWKGNTCLGVLGFGALVALGLFIYWLVAAHHVYITAGLVDARGLDVDEQRRTAAVGFDVSIGFLHLPIHFGVAHDAGHVTVSYADIKLAEGRVSKFYVAGGHKWVEATRAVASAGKDQAPVSQEFRDHVHAEQEVNGEAEFDVALTFFDVDSPTGETTRSYSYSKVGLALGGKPKQCKCGVQSALIF